MNKYEIPIIPCTPIFTAGPVNPGREVDMSTMDKYGLPIIPCTHIFTSRSVNPGRQVDRSTGEQARNTHNALHF